MISVTRLADQALTYNRIPSYSGSYPGTPTYYWDFANPLICYPPSGLPTSDHEEIPYGNLVQGKRAYGALRDKDVHHFAGRGSVIISGRAAASTPRSQPGSGWYTGSETLFGSTKYAYDCIIPWVSGTYSFSWTFTVPPSKVGIYDFTENRVFHVSRILTIKGNTGVIEVAMRKESYSFKEQDPYTLIWKTKTSPASDYTTGYSYFYERKFANGRWDLYSSQQYQRAGLAYSTIPRNAKNVTFGGLRPDPSYYGVTCGVFMTRYEGSIPSYEAGSKAVFNTVCSTLRSEKSRLSITRFRGNETVTLKYGDLTEDLMSQQLFVDANVLLTVFDLLQLKVQVQSFRNLGMLFSDLSKGLLKLPKELIGLLNDTASFARLVGSTSFTWAELFAKYGLTIDYGVLPTVRDTWAVFEGLKKLYTFTQTPNRYHARRSSTEIGLLDTPIVSTVVATSESLAVPMDFLEGLTSGVRGLHEWGLWPDFAMLWDFIPFSFVIDWGLNIGSLADAMDTTMWSEYFPIKYVIYSLKEEWSPSPARIWPYPGVSGAVTFSDYNRFISDTLILPPIAVEKSSGLTSHWAEAAALLVVRSRPRK